MSLRGNAQTLSTEMTDLFGCEYTAETEDIQRIVATDASAGGTITTSGGDVSLPGGGGIPAPAADFDGEGTRTETISLPSEQLPAADLPSDRKPAVSKPPQNGRQNAGKTRIGRTRRSNRRATVTNAIVTVLIVASMIWLVATLKSKIPQNPAAGTPPARMADNPEKPRTEAPETGMAGAESLGQPAGKTGEASGPRLDRPASKPAEDLEKKRALPPPIKHKASRSKKVASARSVAIQALLANAEKNLSQYQLTTPEKDCAYFYFKEVLRLDPRNVGARNGMRRIGDAYGRLAEREIRQFQYETAQGYVKKGLKVAPRNARLLALKKELARPRPLIILEDVGDKVKDLFE
jgi:hypothetical protein